MSFGTLVRSLRVKTGILITVICLSFIMPMPTQAAQLTQRSLKPSSSLSSATGVTYQASFGHSVGTMLGSIEIEFCSNDPIIDSPCTPPAGLNVDAAALADQSGETGFSMHPDTADNRLLITRSAAVSSVNASSYTFTGITNPSATTAYFARLKTFATEDGSGSPTDSGGVSLYTTAVFTVQAEVQPFLEFCVAITISGLDCTATNGTTASLGTFSTTQTASATSQMIGATNASFGYTITVSGTTMTAGNHTIPALASAAPSQLGTSQFGMNLRANSQPAVGAEPVGAGIGNPASGYNTVNQYKYASGDVVASTPATSDYVKFTASYIVNVASSQAPGNYATTLSYSALATY